MSGDASSFVAEAAGSGIDLLARLASVKELSTAVVDEQLSSCIADDVGLQGDKECGEREQETQHSAYSGRTLSLGWGHGRSWLPGEDEALLDAVVKHGPRWFIIAAELQKLGSRRTAAMCRNRHLRIKAPAMGKAGRNRCKRCGQFKRGHTCAAPELARLPSKEMCDRPHFLSGARSPAVTAESSKTMGAAAPRSLLVIH